MEGMDVEEMQREILSYRDLFVGPRVKEVRVASAFAQRLRDLCSYSVGAPVGVPLNSAYGTPVIVDDETVPSDPGYRVVWTDRNDYGRSAVGL